MRNLILSILVLSSTMSFAEGVGSWTYANMETTAPGIQINAPVEVRAKTSQELILGMVDQINSLRDRISYLRNEFDNTYRTKVPEMGEGRRTRIRSEIQEHQLRIIDVEHNLKAQLNSDSSI